MALGFLVPSEYRLVMNPPQMVCVRVGPGRGVSAKHSPDMGMP
jgi:hypothetical protein